MVDENYADNNNTDDLDITKLEQQIFNLNNDITLFELDVEPTKAEAAAIKQQLKAEELAYLARREQLTIAANKIEEQTWEIRRQLNRKKQEIESVQRQIEIAKRLKIQEQSFEMLEAKWATLMAGAPWREWAKDHQISGAKRIATRRRMILADTMGLGKTLTVLIAIDLIKAATNEASEDYPVEYEVW